MPNLPMMTMRKTSGPDSAGCSKTIRGGKAANVTGLGGLGRARSGVPCSSRTRRAPSGSEAAPEVDVMFLWFFEFMSLISHLVIYGVEG